MNLGAIRKLDQNGRVQIPSEIRDALRLTNTTQLNVYVEQGKIIISPLNSKGGIGNEEGSSQSLS